METLKNYYLASNSLLNILTAVAILFLTVIFLFLLKKIVIKKLEVIVSKTKTDFDDFLIIIIKKINFLFFLFVGIYFASKILILPEVVDTFLNYIFIIFLSYEVIKSLNILINYASKKYRQKNKDINETSVRAFVLIVKIIIWILALILILANLGYNVNSLIASLGIGGIAIALALQNILTDIFCSFSIYLDKPFKIGDTISIDELMGTVKKIGIKTTRIETLQGDELIVSNKDLTNSRIRNFKKMQRRRISFDLLINQKTDNQKLKNIAEIIKNIIAKMDKVEYGRVHFKEFGQFGLVFEVVYFIDNNDYDFYMDKQQDLNLAIKEEFDKQNIEIAYPLQVNLFSK